MYICVCGDYLEHGADIYGDVLWRFSINILGFVAANWWFCNPQLVGIPFGKPTVSYRKWPFIVSFPIKSGGSFHSYVCLPEGITPKQPLFTRIFHD